MVREIDSLMPHLKMLFSIWMPTRAKKEGREVKMMKDGKNGERVDGKSDGDKGEAEEKNIKSDIIVSTESGERTQSAGGDNVGGEVDDVTNKISKIQIPPCNLGEKSEKNGNEKKTKSSMEEIFAENKIKNKFNFVLSLEKFMKSQAEDLALLLAGNVSCICTLRFSVIDAVYICSAILKVRIFCIFCILFFYLLPFFLFFLFFHFIKKILL